VVIAAAGKTFPARVAGPTSRKPYQPHQRRGEKQKTSNNSLTCSKKKQLRSDAPRGDEGANEPEDGAAIALGEGEHGNVSRCPVVTRAT
jgi:hypothetical protein